MPPEDFRGVLPASRARRVVAQPDGGNAARSLGERLFGPSHFDPRRDHSNNLDNGAPVMVTYTADLFMTLDGFGTGPVGYWGKEGPQLLEQRARDFFAAEGQTLVFGANTYREMAGFLSAAGDNPNFAALNAAPKVVISRTLQEPLALENTTLMAEDARDGVPRLKAESPLPLRGHGSISMNRALLAAGLVDRLEVMVFPVITGATGSDPILAGLPDIDLELIESRLLDGRIQHLVYVPTIQRDG